MEPAARDGVLIVGGIAAGVAIAVTVIKLASKKTDAVPITKSVPVGAVVEKSFPPWTEGRTAEMVMGDDIKAAVYRGKNDMKIRDLVIGIVKNNGLDGRQKIQVAAACQKWMRENITYIFDPWRTEVFQEARVTLFEKMAGDCDDQAIALAAMLMSVGIPAEIILLSQEPDFNPKTGRFRHVFAAAIVDGGKEVWLETIMPGGDYPDYRHYHTGLMRIDMSTPTLPAVKVIEAIPNGAGVKTPLFFASGLDTADDYR